VKLINEDNDKVKNEAFYVLSNLASSYEKDMDLKFWSQKILGAMISGLKLENTEILKYIIEGFQNLFQLEKDYTSKIKTNDFYYGVLYNFHAANGTSALEELQDHKEKEI